jgi:hypothetical protein
MHAKPYSVCAEPGFEAVFLNDVSVNGTRFERAVELASAIVGHWTKHEAGAVVSMAGYRQVFFDQTPSRRSPSAGVEPSLPLAVGRFTPSRGLPATALRSHR